jgi:hypothetical protein
MDVAIWNILHDGRIIAITGELPGDLTLSVEITYLGRRLHTRAEHLVLELKGCRRIEYRPYEESATHIAHLQATLGLEILSASAAMGQLTIDCADGGAGGQLLADYDIAFAFTSEGEPLAQAVLERASDEYWQDWENKRRSRS